MLPTEELLDWRFCELGLGISAALRADIDQLYRSLERRGISFRPHVWLSTDWFSPDGIPGIAIPFFVAHPRLRELERQMKGEAEGGNRRWRRQILHHEAGHALDTAYGFRRKAGWRATFGPASKAYPNQYSARPASKRFVLHLGHWYAQCHPTEDFAETFAVWLQPRTRWRRDYAGWPALDKLEYVDRLMTEAAVARPKNRDRAIVLPLADNRRTLREHYRRQSHSSDPGDRRYDKWLIRAFARRTSRPRAMPASKFIAAVEASTKRSMKQQKNETHRRNYLFRHATDTLKRRARDLDLVLRHNQRESRRKVIRLHERVVEDLLERNRQFYVI